MLLGLCFVLDAGWNLATYDLRAAYLDTVGAPHFLTLLTAAVYGICGFALMIGYKRHIMPFPLIGILLLMSLVLLTDVNGQGIGEYPAEFHVEVIFKEWVVHIAIMGALLFLATTAPLAEGQARPDWHRIGRLAGRAVLGAYFIINALWQWYYFDIRVEHIVASGGNPNSLPIVIGVQLLCGLLVAGGRWVWVTALPLMFIITLSTILVHGNLSPDAPYPANLQIHQWFVKASILAGLIMVLGERSRARAESKRFRMARQT